MSVDLESLHNILKHSIRRRIVLTLLENKQLAYVDLMNLVEVKNTGKFNYHLKILGDLIEKNGNGKYHLTEKGQLASQLLLRFPEKKSERTPLRGGDAILIGFLGFLIALANPTVLGLFLIGLFGIGILYFSGFLGLVYALMVPSGVMWWLTVKRTDSHDSYDLFKPPLVTFALFILLLIFMIILNIRVTITAPLQDSTSVAMAQPTFPSLPGIGFLSFVGVGILEIIHRFREKNKILGLFDLR